MHKIFCLRCKKCTENKNPVVSHTANGKMMILVYCYDCNSERNRFIKELDAKELFIRLGLETHIRTKNVLIQIHLCEYLGCY